MNNKLINAVHQALELTKYDDYKNGHEIPDQILINEMLRPKSQHYHHFPGDGQLKACDYTNMSKKLMVLSKALSAHNPEN